MLPHKVHRNKSRLNTTITLSTSECRESAKYRNLLDGVGAESGQRLAFRNPSAGGRGQHVKLTELAGEKIQTVLTHAPGNGAPIGGLKVVAESGWFAARPSGTEDIYKIYAESFQGADHLSRILEEAQTLVNDALATVPKKTMPTGTTHSKGKS